MNDGENEHFCFPARMFADGSFISALNQVLPKAKHRGFGFVHDPVKVRGHASVCRRHFRGASDAVAHDADVISQAVVCHKQRPTAVIGAKIPIRRVRADLFRVAKLVVDNLEVDLSEEVGAGASC